MRKAHKRLPKRRGKVFCNRELIAKQLRGEQT
jgi:hypothetical protein